MKLRLLADLIETKFDYSSVAYAMKEDVWQTYVHVHILSSISLFILYIHSLLVLAAMNEQCINEGRKTCL